MPSTSPGQQLNMFKVKGDCAAGSQPEAAPSGRRGLGGDRQLDGFVLRQDQFTLAAGRQLQHQLTSPGFPRERRPERTEAGFRTTRDNQELAGAVLADCPVGFYAAASRLPRRATRAREQTIRLIVADENLLVRLPAQAAFELEGHGHEVPE